MRVGLCRLPNKNCPYLSTYFNNIPEKSHFQNIFLNFSLTFQALQLVRSFPSEPGIPTTCPNLCEMAPSEADREEVSQTGRGTGSRGTFSPGDVILISQPFVGVLDRKWKFQVCLGLFRYPCSCGKAISSGISRANLVNS